MAVDLLREALLRVFAKKNEIRVVGSNSYSPAIHAQIVTTAPAIIVLDSSGLSHPVHHNELHIWYGRSKSGNESGTGPNRARVREILGSGKSLAGVRFAWTGEVKE